MRLLTLDIEFLTWFLINQPTEIRSENSGGFQWSSSLVHDNQMLGPNTDMLGLPVVPTPAATAEPTLEEMAKYLEGQIHQALDFLPTEQIKQIVQAYPNSIHERGKDPSTYTHT